MANIINLASGSPTWGADCFLAPNATLIGQVTMGAQCSIWFQAVLRGDVGAIKLGDRVNIQDGAVIHSTYQKSEVIIGDDVSVGHNAILHGCKIESRVLIGMGAIVMDNVQIPSGTMLGAGTLVPPNSVLEPGFLYVGNPYRKLRALSEDEYQFYITRTSENYIKYSSWFEQ